MPSACDCDCDIRASESCLVLSFVCARGFGAVVCVVAWRVGVGTRPVGVAVLMLNNIIIVSSSFPLIVHCALCVRYLISDVYCPTKSAPLALSDPTSKDE
eukprot:scaffold19219_cov34-Tisochrysis_lutea.AAC.1